MFINNMRNIKNALFPVAVGWRTKYERGFRDGSVTVV